MPTEAVVIINIIIGTSVTLGHPSIEVPTHRQHYKRARRGTRGLEVHKGTPLLITFSPEKDCNVHLMYECSVRVVSNSLQPHGLHSARLLSTWDFPGKNTGVDCHFLLQGIFLTTGSNSSFLCPLHWKADSLPLSQLLKPQLFLTELI